jgi:hypothetical protein
MLACRGHWELRNRASFADISPRIVLLDRAGELGHSKSTAPLISTISLLCSAGSACTSALYIMEALPSRKSNAGVLKRSSGTATFLTFPFASIWDQDYGGNNVL